MKHTFLRNRGIKITPIAPLYKVSKIRDNFYLSDFKNHLYVYMASLKPFLAD